MCKFISAWLFCQALLAADHSLNSTYSPWPQCMKSFHELTCETLLEKDTVSIGRELAARQAQELSIDNEHGDFMKSSTIVLSFPPKYIDSILEKGFLNTHQVGGLSNGHENQLDNRDILEQIVCKTRFPRLDKEKDSELVSKLDELRPKSAFLDFKWEKRGEKCRNYGGMVAVFTSDEVKSRTFFTISDSLGEINKWNQSGEKPEYKSLYLDVIKKSYPATDTKTIAGTRAFGTPLLTKGLSVLPNRMIPCTSDYREAMIFGKLLANDAEYFVAGSDKDDSDENQLDNIISATSKLIAAGKKVKKILTGNEITRDNPEFAQLFIDYLNYKFKQQKRKLKIKKKREEPVKIIEKEILSQIEILSKYEIKLIFDLFPKILEKLFKHKHINVANLIINNLEASDSEFSGIMLRLSSMVEQRIILLNEQLVENNKEEETYKVQILRFKDAKNELALNGSLHDLNICLNNAKEINFEIKKYQEFLDLILNKIRVVPRKC